MTDDHRIHIAANDPAFPAKREAAFALVCAAIDAVATPIGYTRKGTTWSRSTAQGRTIVNLQRNQYGWHADINLRFILPDGAAATSADWAGGDDLQIGRFYKPGEGRGANPGQIAYLDIGENPLSLDELMAILRDRAVPWLDAHHAGIAPALPT